MLVDTTSIAAQPSNNSVYFAIIITAIITFILTGLLAPILKEFLIKYFEQRKVWSFGKLEFKSRNQISNYFESKIPEIDADIDVFFYQFGLRPTIPIMDWLYLEYINALSLKVQIKKLVIFPIIDKSRETQSNLDFEKFSTNIKKIVKVTNIEIIDPHNYRYFNKEDLVSDEFITTLKYLGSEEHFEFLRRDFYLKITSISDFNRFHPLGDKIKDIYTHIYKSWGIVNYIKENVDLSKPVKISAIFWEWEVDTIGVIKHFSNKVDNIMLYPVLGKTQMLNKTIPVPVFIEHETICIFDDTKIITEKALRFLPFLKKYNSLLECVLCQYKKIDRKEISQNGKKEWESFKVSNDLPENRIIKVTNEFYLFLGLIKEIKLIIKNGNRESV